VKVNEGFQVEALESLEDCLGNMPLDTIIGFLPAPVQVLAAWQCPKGKTRRGEGSLNCSNETDDIDVWGVAYAKPLMNGPNP
jgi:hypothetical protein